MYIRYIIFRSYTVHISFSVIFVPEQLSSAGCSFVYPSEATKFYTGYTHVREYSNATNVKEDATNTCINLQLY